MVRAPVAGIQIDVIAITDEEHLGAKQSHGEAIADTLVAAPDRPRGGERWEGSQVSGVSVDANASQVDEEGFIDALDHALRSEKEVEKWPMQCMYRNDFINNDLEPRETAKIGAQHHDSSNLKPPFKNSSNRISGGSPGSTGDGLGPFSGGRFASW